MTTTTATLADFLLARLDEDEAAARAATPGPWHADDLYSTVTAAPFTSAREAYNRGSSNFDCWVIPESQDSGVGWHNLSHIARHDPARVLREVAAKRAIVGLHEPAMRFENVRVDSPPHVFANYVRGTSDGPCQMCGGEFPCDTLRALASAYADHEDYRAEWA